MQVWEVRGSEYSPVIGEIGIIIPPARGPTSDWSEITRKLIRDANKGKLEMLLTGKALNSSDATGWLVDYSGSLEETLQVVWKIVSNGDHEIKKQEIDSGVITGLEICIKTYGSNNPLTIAGSKAIIDCAINSCSVNLDESIVVQAKHSARFMGSNNCRKGLIGSEADKFINF